MMPREKKRAAAGATTERRLGRTPAEWLAWVLRFAQMDLDSLRLGEVTALGDDLRLLPEAMGQTPSAQLDALARSHAAAKDVGYTTALKAVQQTRAGRELAQQTAGVLRGEHGTPMPASAVREVQRAIADGLRELAKPGGGWPVPGQDAVVIYRESARGPWTRFRVSWFTSGGDRRTILAAVGRLLLDHGQKVRWCPECGVPFVSTRRQAYCSVRCSQRVRNQRRKVLDAGANGA
jgi:hypothetical protein